MTSAAGRAEVKPVKATSRVAMKLMKCMMNSLDGVTIECLMKEVVTVV